MKEKYDETKNYDGKWILFRKTYANDYESIFVIFDKNGIIKYVTEMNTYAVKYVESDEFKYYAEFFENPVQMLNPFENKNRLTDFNIELTQITPNIQHYPYVANPTSVPGFVPATTVYCSYGKTNQST